MGVKPGYKQTEVGVIPEEWLERSVGQLIAEGIIEKPLDGNHGNIHPKSGDFVEYGIPFVMANNVQGGRVDLVNCSFIRKKQADALQKGFSKTGDILLTHKATIGNTAIVGEIPFDYIMLTPQVTYYRVADKNRLSNLYLRQFFDSTGFQSVMRALSGGGTRSYIGIKAQHQLPVVLPPTVTEQRAIAGALSDVDALLGALAQLIAKKRDLKQAAMQQLLTGQTRLPGLHGEWAVQLLGEVADVKTGPFGSSLHESDYVQDGTPIITVEHLGEFGVEHVNLPLISDSDRQRLRTYALEVGDIVFSRVGSVDRNALIRPAEEGWLFSGRLLRVRPDKQKAFAPFLSYQFHGEIFKGLVRNVAVGQTMACLNTQILKGISVLVPSVAEQTAIAEVLTDMDAELAALEQRRAKTRALKQGMMQELLTGKTRLVES